MATSNIHDGSPSSGAQAARSEVRRGPVTVTVEVRPAKARLSDEPKLTLTIRAPQGVLVRKPPFGEALGDFLIRDFRQQLPRLESDREVIEHVYTLEPTRVGRLVIYPISVTFVDKRPGHDGKPQTLTTEALTVEVTSVLGAEAPSLEKLRPLAGPVELPEERALGWWLVLGAVPAALVAGAAWLWCRRRRRAAAETPLSPQELALLELERLLQQGFAQADVKRFYVELTGIVRRYIERTHGIRAPEQTTEEFLREIERRRTFAEEESRRLGEFLEAADLVKFAAHQPRHDDIDESVRRAKAFVGSCRASDEVAV